MPRYSDNKEYINELSPEFNQTNNNIKIQFNDESLISVNKSLKISDPESEPGWQGQITFDGSESKRNIEIRFTYEYTNNGVTYYVSGLNDTYSLKIFPPSSKYARNVVFNEEGINELVGYFKQYPITKLENGEKYGHIKITKGIDEESEVSPKGLENSTEDSLLCSTDFIPNENDSFNLGSDSIVTYTYNVAENFDSTNTKYFYKDVNTNSYYPVEEEINNSRQFLDQQDVYGELFTRVINESTPVLKWKNLYLSNGVYASELQGKYIGLPQGITGDSININDKFVVDSEGNVHMAGDITWGNENNNPIKILTVYHKGNQVEHTSENIIGQIASQILESMYTTYIPPDPPAENTINFPENDPDDNNHVWHTIYNSEKDNWMTTSYDQGKTWTAPSKIGEEYKPGPTPIDILGFLEASDNQGIFSFDTVNGQKKIGIKTDAILTKLLETNSIIMKPVWDDNNHFEGGFITFVVPTPRGFTLNSNYLTEYNNILRERWKGRLGYLLGDGTTTDNSGVQGTAGLGFALYSGASYSQIYNTNRTEDEKKHLLLARLLLTDAGFSLTLRANATDPDWYYTDTGTKYFIRWWNGNNESTKYIADSTNHDSQHQPVTKRLWIDEDSGQLFIRNGNIWTAKNNNN